LSKKRLSHFFEKVIFRRCGGEIFRQSPQSGAVGRPLALTGWYDQRQRAGAGWVDTRRRMGCSPLPGLPERKFLETFGF